MDKPPAVERETDFGVACLAWNGRDARYTEGAWKVLAIRCKVNVLSVRNDAKTLLLSWALGSIGDEASKIGGA